MREAERINIFWFRRDLRLDDNTGLNSALSMGLPVLPLFIFDTGIISDLSPSDARVTFIHDALRGLNNKLAQKGSSILVRTGNPERIWEELASEYNIGNVFTNRDYEPYATGRDTKVAKLLSKKGIRLHSFKDQVIFEENDIVTAGGKPYTVFTPYRNRWMKEYELKREEFLPSELPVSAIFFKSSFRLPSLKEIGFARTARNIGKYDLARITDYDKYRDFPAYDYTTRLGPHLRFGTVSIRRIVAMAAAQNRIFLGELIWREFFMQILFNFPHVVTGNFRKKYDNVAWRNNEAEFSRWCNGGTGYPFVDAGMRQLNETGFMHNRARMITAGFLCKHLLTHWSFGEAYFAEKLDDFELASNNGNWQWVAGTGCDAAPFFRVFNPYQQQKKFDPHNEYVRKWVPEYGKSSYPEPVVEHGFARERAIEAYRKGLIR